MNETSSIPSTESIEQKIKDSYTHLSKSEKLVAKYIIDNHAQAALMSSTELAYKVNVSDTTVIRFAKSLGFSGYSDFKKALRINLNTNNTPLDFLKRMNIEQDNHYVISYTNSMFKDIEEFISYLDYNQVDEIVNLLFNAETIYVAGIGSDSIVAKYLFIYFRKMGLNTELITEEGHTMRERLLKVTDKDVTIMCSFPRLLKDEKELAKIVKAAGMPLITMTDSDITSMTLDGDINIRIKENRKTFFNSYVIPMFFCNLLLLKMYEFNPEKIEVGFQKYLNLQSSEDWL